MRKQTGISSGNSLAPVRRQAIIWTDAGLLLLGPLGTNFSEIRIKIQFNLHSRKWFWKCLQNGGYFVSAFIHESMVAFA